MICLIIWEKGYNENKNNLFHNITENEYTRWKYYI